MLLSVYVSQLALAKRVYVSINTLFPFWSFIHLKYILLSTCNLFVGLCVCVCVTYNHSASAHDLAEFYVESPQNKAVQHPHPTVFSWLLPQPQPSLPSHFSPHSQKKTHTS